MFKKYSQSVILMPNNDSKNVIKLFLSFIVIQSSLCGIESWLFLILSLYHAVLLHLWGCIFDCLYFGVSFNGVARTLKNMHIKGRLLEQAVDLP